MLYCYCRSLSKSKQTFESEVTSVEPDFKRDFSMEGESFCLKLTSMKTSKLNRL